MKTAAKRIRTRIDIEGKDEPRLDVKETEFLYPVGSEHCKMFRVIERKSKIISTVKKCTLNLLDVSSYKVFLSCINEAIFLSNPEVQKLDFVLKSKGEEKRFRLIA